jgi:hypothetical protein
MGLLQTEDLLALDCTTNIEMTVVGRGAAGRDPSAVAVTRTSLLVLERAFDARCRGLAERRRCCVAGKVLQSCFWPEELLHAHSRAPRHAAVAGQQWRTAWIGSEVGAWCALASNRFSDRTMLWASCV